MTQQQIENRIADLEWWLKHNPNHPDRVTLEGDVRKLKLKLIPQHD